MRNIIIVDEYGFVVDFVHDEEKEVAQVVAIELCKE